MALTRLLLYNYWFTGFTEAATLSSSSALQIWESNLKQTKVVYFKILSIYHSQLLQRSWGRFVKWIRETD